MKLPIVATIAGYAEIDHSIATLVLAFGTDPVARWLYGDPHSTCCTSLGYSGPSVQARLTQEQRSAPTTALGSRFGSHREFTAMNEAQVSQRPIAIYGLEHIGATDRGVMMFPNQTRRGIRAVRADHDPAALCRDAGTVIPTYCNNTVVRMPPDADPAMDRQRMRETARVLADGYLKDPPLLAFDRGAWR